MAMKAINKHILIKGDLYPFDIYVSFNEKYSVLEKNLRKLLPEEDWIEIRRFDDNPYYNARTVQFSGCQIALNIKRLNHGVIAHEVFHICDFVFSTIGIKLSDTSDEAYAYYIQWLTNKVYQNIK